MACLGYLVHEFTAPHSGIQENHGSGQNKEISEKIT